MNVHWYNALSLDQKQQLCDELKRQYYVANYHPGSLLFAPQELVSNIVRYMQDLILCRKLINTCGRCGNEFGPMIHAYYLSNDWRYSKCRRCRENTKG